MIEPDMRTYLSNTSTAADNFYLNVATQSPTMPYGVISKVSPGREYTHDGKAYSVSRMQCSCYGSNYQSAKLMADNVITKMELWPSSTSGASVQAVFLANEIDMVNENAHHVAVDFFIWHTY